MGIQKFINRNLPETAVYWGNPQTNGYGGYTYDDPVEIACRWEEMRQVINMDNGERIHSRAVVYSAIDLDENGLLWKGNLDDLLSSSGESTGEIDLSIVDLVFSIKRWGKTPALNSTTNYLRKSYLTPYLT